MDETEVSMLGELPSKNVKLNIQQTHQQQLSICLE